LQKNPTHIPDIGELLNHLAPKTDCPGDRFDLDPDRNWQVEPVKGSEEELDQETKQIRKRGEISGYNPAHE